MLATEDWYTSVLFRAFGLFISKQSVPILKLYDVVFL